MPPPKYLQMAARFREQILQGELPFGHKLESETALVASHGVSRQTVRQAFAVLEQEGLIQRRRGSGTYVCHQQPIPRARTGNIGVVSTYLDSYIFPRIIQGIEAVLSAGGCSVQLALTHNQVHNERRALETMLEKGVDGLIVEPTKSALPNPNRPLYEEIGRLGIPLVFFNAYYPDLDAPHVCLDDRLAGRTAAEYLIGMGHRNIAGLFQSDDRQGPLRYAGYLEALTAAGLEERAGRVLWFATEDIPHLPEDFGRVLRCLEGCTAAVCYNDQIAYTAITELKKRGIAVPDQISVIGVDNSALAAVSDPPITTLAHPMERLGRVCAENLLKLIEDPAFDATVEFPPQLVERATVRRTGLW